MPEHGVRSAHMRMCDAAAGAAQRNTSLQLHERQRLRVETRPSNGGLSCKLPHCCSKGFHQELLVRRQADIVRRRIVPFKHQLSAVTCGPAPAFAAVVDRIDLLNVHVTVPAGAYVRDRHKYPMKQKAARTATPFPPILRWLPPPAAWSTGRARLAAAPMQLGAHHLPR